MLAGVRADVARRATAALSSLYERLADRAGDRSAQDVLGARLAVAALGQIVVADAEILEAQVIALRFGAQHLRLGQRVLEARADRLSASFGLRIESLK